MHKTTAVAVLLAAWCCTAKAAPETVTGRYVNVSIPGNGKILSLAEVPNHVVNLLDRVFEVVHRIRKIRFENPRLKYIGIGPANRVTAAKFMIWVSQGKCRSEFANTVESWSVG